MAQTADHTSDGVGVWGGGIVGGLVGGIAMGFVLHLGANQIHLFGAFVGEPTVVGGWTVHLLFSVLFGMAFAALVSSRLVEELADGAGTGFATYVAFGLMYGALLGLVAGGLLLPLSLNRLGVMAYPVPVLPVPGIGSEMLFAVLLAIAHLVYGVFLGGIYATVNASGPSLVTERISAIGR